MDLRRSSIQTVQPYRFTFSPTYVYMQRNQKFICVKAPLDFFLTDELDKLKAHFSEVYVLPFVDKVAPFVDAGKSARILLGWNPETKEQKEVTRSKNIYPQVGIPPAPYELSDAIIRILGSVWGSQFEIEPFFVAIFIDELCGSLSSELLESSREKDIQLLEHSILLSSWIIFIALHMGYTNLGYLERIRNRVFKSLLNEEDLVGADPDLQKIVEIGTYAFKERKGESISGLYFKERSEVVSKKLESRLNRIQKELLGSTPAPSIIGPEGFCDI